MKKKIRVTKKLVQSIKQSAKNASDEEVVSLCDEYLRIRFELNSNKMTKKIDAYIKGKHYI